MPHLKSHAAVPAIKEAVVLDLGDIGAQAAKLRLAAEARAQQIIAEAESKAAELIDAARGTGLEEGRAQGHAEGLKQGHEQGKAEALAQWQEQLQNLTDAWADAASRFDAHRAQLRREAHHAVLRFAVRMGEKLTHRVVEVDESVILDQVAAALDHVL
ncbi:MAG: hypothetical protein AAGB29_12690, partial [Planctomycetota bacterium]